MIQEDRLEKIKELLRQKRFTSIDELSKKLYCSKSTVRRDLIELEQASIVRRTRGGVTLLSDQSFDLPSNFRHETNKEKKREIAKIAHRFVRSDSTVFLDSSTTVSALNPYLSKIKNLKIITNSLLIAQDLTFNPDSAIYIIGGLVKSFSESIIGTSALTMASGYFPDLCILSCKFIDTQGVYESDPEQAAIKQKMLEQSKHAILLCDSSKFGQSSFKCFAHPDDFKAIITDSGLSDDEFNDFSRVSGAHLIKADSDSSSLKIRGGGIFTTK